MSEYGIEIQVKPGVSPPPGLPTAIARALVMSGLTDYEMYRVSIPLPIRYRKREDNNFLTPFLLVSVRRENPDGEPYMQGLGEIKLPNWRWMV